MFTIDIHTHIIPERIPDFGQRFGYGGFVTLDHYKPCCARMIKDGQIFREMMDNSWSAEKRIKECDHHKVDVQVLSTVPVMFNYQADPEDCLEVSRFLNNHIAEIVNLYPKRFVGLGTLPMQDPSLAVEELERCIKMGLNGIQIGSHINNWNLSNPKVFPVFEAAAKLGAAVFVHPWDMMAQDKMLGYWRPWLVGMPAETSLAITSMIFGGVFERLPELRIAFAHGGGSFPATIGRIEHAFHTRPDLCAVDNNIAPKKYLGRFYLDSLVHEPAMLDYIIKLVGADKVAMGSDYPFPLGETEPGKLIRSMNYEADVKERLLSGTALEWLGLSEKQFA